MWFSGRELAGMCEALGLIPSNTKKKKKKRKDKKKKE